MYSNKNTIVFYNCDKCESQFRSRHSLKMHQENTHESKEHDSKYKKVEKPLPFEEASRLPKWEAVCSIAVMLKKQVKKIGLNLKLDQVTPGKGNCFFIAVLQQLRRPEIYATISRSLQQMADTWDHLALRKAVCSFAKSSPEVAARRELIIYAMYDVKPWDTFWGPDHMMKSREWVDAAAVQVSAWFLGMDLLILSDTSNHQSPRTRISSSFDDIIDGSKQEILLGAKTDIHYQSLLPKDSDSVTVSHSSYSRTSLDNKRESAKAAPATNPVKIQQKPQKDSVKTANSHQGCKSTSPGYKTIYPYMSLGVTPGKDVGKGKQKKKNLENRSLSCKSKNNDKKEAKVAGPSSASIPWTEPSDEIGPEMLKLAAEGGITITDLAKTAPSKKQEAMKASSPPKPQNDDQDIIEEITLDTPTPPEEKQKNKTHLSEEPFVQVIEEVNETNFDQAFENCFALILRGSKRKADSEGDRLVKKLKDTAPIRSRKEGYY